MNDVLTTLFNHKSDRSFLDKPVSDDILDNVINAAYHAPTSINSQQVSVIVVRDKARRQRLSQLCGGQPWIATAPIFLVFVFDMHKTKLGIQMENRSQKAQQSIESIVSGSTDVGIALNSALVAAHSQGLGGVPIGGIRLNPQEVIDELKLPENTFAIAGLSIGYVDQPAQQKPRLSIDTFRHEEHYHSENLIEQIRQYNQRLNAHWENIGRSDGEHWSHSVAGYYSRIYYPDVAPTLIKQGFTNQY
ncbi:NADPH-dependent oxidoreductase [Celerinatantimonas diazotrophica]|uniref:FMN reductase [NAD(P)H] n=1 Tax=Celerinatantimonas diazotrophica TaxID=412034 RepID=A0A4R1K420_9GAMM|nr:NADPH-dependent oxidoreductase [Celerinatantimonas diazotrophica]TCK58844.1 FMN reductase [NAD(P)H] [Celerinatantimonas diazotrophica]CAG9297476.1 FMN reductase [NAD(P)H] [Celerinatantimonas diazotrophica]